ncbi:ATPase [Metabacillus sp. 84]|uniref:ATPase n=1 Tax=Metabacillus sp. 84 TaxID=3404705 RepID=UPI003CEFA85E
MRDIQKIHLTEEEWLIAASDNAGAIGEMEHDLVNVPLEITASHTLRVALMECLAVGAAPFSIILHNFIGNKAWKRLSASCDRLMKETGFDGVSITGSTESNMTMMQSAIGITVLGRVAKNLYRSGVTPLDAGFAVVGEPLVGEEVITKADRMVSLSLFQELCRHDGVFELIPAGSGGIAREIRYLNPEAKFIDCELNMHKSAGPASCVIIAYNKQFTNDLKNLANGLFYPVHLSG